jgi:hypothetical protein
MNPQTTETEHDGCYFLDKLTVMELRLRLLDSIAKIEEESRVLAGIATRIAGGI